LLTLRAGSDVTYDMERDPGRTHETVAFEKAPVPAAGARMSQDMGPLSTGVAASQSGQSPSASSDQIHDTAHASSAIADLTAEAIATACSAQQTAVGVHRAEATALAMTADEIIATSPGLANPQHTGGRMSLQDTIAQIASLQRAIQDQTRLVNDFMKSNSDTMQLVRTELKGSTKGYDQMMLSALSQTESSLRASLSALQQASTALDRVKAI